MDSCSTENAIHQLPLAQLLPLPSGRGTFALASGPQSSHSSLGGTGQAVTVMTSLAAPFDEGLVRFKPAAFAGKRALAMPYVDVRVIEDRLDEVLGPANWQDEYECLPGGSVTCRLKLRLDGEWITKMDVGAPSEQMDEGDRRKAAFSDALKRAAVKFGIGRYLYRMGGQWLDYDPHRRQFLTSPRMQGARSFGSRS